MLKTVAAGVTALFVTASPLAYAQAPSAGAHERLSEADLSALTDARINIVKAALELTPDQEKFWPPIEAAIRARARDRQARIAAVAARLREQHERSPIDVLRDRDPVDLDTVALVGWFLAGCLFADRTHTVHQPSLFLAVWTVGIFLHVLDDLFATLVLGHEPI